MKLSIITINLNNLEGLKRTIPSMVSQTYTEFEYIVVDGNSTDGSKEYIASQERIDQWISEPDTGIYNAMNKGIQMAHGEYCIFMNSGDSFCNSQVLEKCMPLLKDYDYIAGRSIFLGADTCYPFIPPKKLNLEFLFLDALNHQSLFIKTSVLRELPYNEGFRIVSDWEQYFKAWYIHDCSYKPIDEFVSIFRLDGISIGSNDLIKKEKDIAIRQMIKEDAAKGVELKERYELFLKNRRMPSFENKHERNRQKLRRNLNNVLAKRSPFQRNIGVIRYGFKYLFKDLFF